MARGAGREISVGVIVSIIAGFIIILVTPFAAQRCTPRTSANLDVDVQKGGSLEYEGQVLPRGAADGAYPRIVLRLTNTNVVAMEITGAFVSVSRYTPLSEVAEGSISNVIDPIDGVTWSATIDPQTRDQPLVREGGTVSGTVVEGNGLEKLIVAPRTNVGGLYELEVRFDCKVDGVNTHTSGHVSLLLDPNHELARRQGIAVWRLYNTSTREHFYTQAGSERDGLVARGWRDEGVAFYAARESSTVVYRLNNRTIGRHFYTTRTDERDLLLSGGVWIDEGVAFYASDSASVGVPVYRLYHSGRRDHFFTTDAAERERVLESGGWRDEDVAFYVSAGR